MLYLFSSIIHYVSYTLLSSEAYFHPRMVRTFSGQALISPDLCSEIASRSEPPEKERRGRERKWWEMNIPNFETWLRPWLTLHVVDLACLYMSPHNISETLEIACDSRCEYLLYLSWCYYNLIYVSSHSITETGPHISGTTVNSKTCVAEITATDHWHSFLIACWDRYIIYWIFGCRFIGKSYRISKKEAYVISIIGNNCHQHLDFFLYFEIIQLNLHDYLWSSVADLMLVVQFLRLQETSWWQNRLQRSY